MNASIIIPIGDSQDFLNQSLESIYLDIKNEKVEILLIGEQNAISAAEKKISKNQKLETIVNKDKGTVSSNLNLGIKYATGDVIFRMDSDDIWLVKRLRNQMTDLYKKENPISIGKALHISSNGLALPKLIPNKIENDFDPRILVIANNITHPTVAFRREWIETHNYPHSQFEDWALWIRERSFLKNLEILNVNLIKYRVHKNQTSRKVVLNSLDPIVNIWFQALHLDYGYTPKLSSPVDFLQRNVTTENMNEFLHLIDDLKKLLLNSGVAIENINSFLVRTMPIVAIKFGLLSRQNILFAIKVVIRELLMKASK
jgi:glycosyltransferase involved in cell wall biosynthesis